MSPYYAVDIMQLEAWAIDAWERGHYAEAREIAESGWINLDALIGDNTNGLDQIVDNGPHEVMRLDITEAEINAMLDQDNRNCPNCGQPRVKGPQS